MYYIIVLERAFYIINSITLNKKSKGGHNNDTKN